MRYCRIAIICLLASCKATVPTSRSVYSEDLSVLRPKPTSNEKEDKSLKVRTEDFTPMYGHIKAEMDSIISISVAENKEGKLVDGYSLIVYTGNNRNESKEVWRRIVTNFPSLDPKISYRQPNFQVRAHRFQDRLKAHRALQAVKREFPKALLVPERYKISYE